MKRPAAAPEPPPPAGRPRKRGLTRGAWHALRILVLSLAAAAGVVGARLWQNTRLPQRVRAALPPPPEFRDAPAAQREAWMKIMGDLDSRTGAIENAFALAALYQENGYERRARQVWEIVAAEQPRNPRPYYYLAKLAIDASDDSAAERNLDRATWLDPRYAPAWLKLGDLELKLDKRDAAENAYRRTLELQPDNPYASLGLARAALARGQRAEARAQLEKLVAATPNFPSAQNLLAEMLEQDGDAKGAAQHRWLGTAAGRFREMDDPWLDELERWCFDPARLIARGTMEFQTQHGDRGRARFERAVELAPDSAEAQAALADLYVKLGDAAGARAILEKARTLPHPVVKVFTTLSEADLALRDFSSAIAAAEQGLALFPDATELEVSLGLADAKAGRLVEAVQVLQKALASRPASPMPAFDLATVLLELGRRAEAHAALEQALAAQPQFPQALGLLSQLELQEGKLDEAWKHIEPFYNAYPGSTQARSLMARWYLANGAMAARDRRLADAEESYRHGLSIEPEMPELLASLGVLYLQEEHWAAALEPLETYHRVRGNDPKAALFLAEAHARLGHAATARQLASDARALAERIQDADTQQRAAQLLARLEQ